MTGQLITPIIVDTDNALRTPRTLLENIWGGDVDDAFSLVYLIKSGIPISHILSVGGNTSAELAHQNNIELLKLLHQTDVAICVKGLDPKESRQLPISASGKINYLALGPLTNLSKLLDSDFKPESLMVTLGRIYTRGRLPPYWPIEFNATFDLPAFLKVFKQSENLIVTPLDVAFHLQLGRSQIQRLQNSEIGRYLSKNSRRWLLRSLLLKGRYSFPVWDLLSAVYSTHSELCKMQDGIAYVFRNGLCIYDVPGEKVSSANRDQAIYVKKVKVMTGFNEDAIWDHFFKTIEN